jgi:23S rRNA (cytosine1962-C5)-methyltransferase
MKKFVAEALQPRPFALDHIEALPQVVVSRPVLHPNIFRKRLLKVQGRARPGDWVAVLAAEHGRRDEPAATSVTEISPIPSIEPRLFAYGIYNDRSEVAVRLYRWWGDRPDEAGLEELLERAVSLRCVSLRLDENVTAYRVIHGEADGFPGLVVDRYGDCLSAEIFSLGMYQRAEDILNRLAARLGTAHWLMQPCPQFLSQEGFDAPPRASAELPESVVIHEYGTKFRVHFASSHKTGFFCDQRDNRKQLAELCRGKSVLDLCCYSGGFSVQAAKLGQAAEVTGVDIDEEPLKLAAKNANINQVRVRWVQSDAFAFIRDMLKIGRQYDIVVLDPPKLIRNRAELEEGTRKHADLNRLAMQLVKPGGLMLSCSCAGLLAESTFVQMIRAAAKATGFDDTGRPRPPRLIQILSRHGAAADHPVAGFCPETEYLKSVWMRVI